MSAEQHVLLVERGNLRRRNAANRLVEWSSTIAAVLAVAVLLIVVGSVFLKGVGALSWHFLTTPTALFGETGGGISNAIIGSAIIVGIASAIAIPVGILVAIFTTEFAPPRIANPVRFVLDILNGVPTIITGIFVYGLLVVPQGKQSGWAASVALAIVMLPIVARTAQDDAEGSVLGARHRPLARGAAGDDPDRDGRPGHRLPARRRPGGGGDGTADLRLLDLPAGCAHRPQRSPRLDPDLHLPIVGVAEARGPHRSLGGGADPDRLRPRAEHRREGLLRPQPETDEGLNLDPPTEEP